jgi:hypothetical protein
MIWLWMISLSMVASLPGQMVKTPNFGQAEQDVVLSGENDSSLIAISKVLPLMGRITVHYY